MPQRLVAEGIEGLNLVLKRMSFPCRAIPRSPLNFKTRALASAT